MEKDEKNTKLHFEYIPLKHKDLVWCDLILFVFSIIMLNHLISITETTSTLFGVIAIASFIIYLALFIFLFGIGFVALATLEIGYIIEHIITIIQAKENEKLVIIFQNVIWIIMFIVACVLTINYLF